MAEFTSVADNNWAFGTTWHPNGVPGPGDSVTILTTVTVTLDTAVGDTSDGAVTISGSGLLVIDAVLTVYGGVDGAFSIDTGGELILLNTHPSVECGVGIWELRRVDMSVRPASAIRVRGS